MLGVVAAIVAATAVGIAAERRLGAPARRMARGSLDALFWVLVPFVSFFALSRLRLTAGVGAGLGLAYLELAVVGAGAFVVGRRLRLSRPATGSLICAVALANTGYLGLPLTAAVLGTGALGAAIAFDSLVSGPMFYLAGFAIGALFGSRGAGGARARLWAFVRNPPLAAAVAGLLVPHDIAPDGLVQAAHLLVYALLPLGFFVLGVNLAAEAEVGGLAFPPPLTRPVGAAVALRLVVAPALLAALSAIIVAVPHAYLLQAAMPSGINSLIVAHQYGLDVRLTSAALAWTTALAIVGGAVASALL